MQTAYSPQNVRKISFKIKSLCMCNYKHKHRWTNVLDYIISIQCSPPIIKKKKIQIFINLTIIWIKLTIMNNTQWNWEENRLLLQIKSSSRDHKMFEKFIFIAQFSTLLYLNCTKIVHQTHDSRIAYT